MRQRVRRPALHVLVIVILIHERALALFETLATVCSLKESVY